jgi:hypothetical protein
MEIKFHFLSVAWLISRRREPGFPKEGGDGEPGAWVPGCLIWGGDPLGVSVLSMPILCGFLILCGFFPAEDNSLPVPA